MKIAVVGAGGVGGYFGGMLAEAGNDVTLVARGVHLQSIQQQGLRIEHPDGNLSTIPVKTLDSAAGNFDTTDTAQSAADLVIVALKGSQLDGAGQLISKLCKTDTLVLPLLNGISAPAILSQQLPQHEILGGLCGIIAQIREPGVIKHIGIDPLVTFGQIKPDPAMDERLLAIHSAFEKAKVKATIADDIQLSMWRKFLFICPLSAATSVTRATIGELRSIPESMQLFEQLLDETLAVGMAHGIPLTREHRDFVVQQVHKSPQDGTTSMQRDIRDAKPSELETQVGAALRLGEQHNIPTPALSFVNSALIPQEIASRKS